MNITSYTSAHPILNYFLKNKSVYLFLFSALLILIISPLFQRGCFIDGMLYKTVAYNYSQGLSSFWNMKYTDTCMSFFCEQPPLYFYLLGFFYKLFGTSYLVDRLFTFVLFIGFLYVLYAICQLLFKKNRAYFLLAVFFLLSIQVICWTVVNQVIETLVLLEISLGIWIFIKYLERAKIFYLLLFVPLLIVLFLTKGFQSCFIIVLPITYLILSKWNRSVLYFSGFSIFSFLAVVIAILMLYPPSVKWYTCYYEARILLTLKGVGATTDNHFEIIIRFFTEVIGVVFVLMGLLIFIRVKKSYPLVLIFKNFKSNTLAVSLLITAMAGSLPFALSLVQRGFYLVPSFICFVLALILGFKCYWMFLFEGLNMFFGKRMVQFAVISISFSALIYSIWTIDHYKREKELAQDLQVILPILKMNETVMISENLWNYFNLHSYFYMAKQVNLTLERDKPTFMISHKKDSLVNRRYKLQHLKLDTKELDVYYLGGKLD